MPKKHKILTLEQLIKFCEENSFYSFDSKTSGYSLSIQVPGIFECASEPTQGLLFTKLKVCHTLLNRNNSYISEENMKKAMPSLKYRPVLGYIHQLDSGEYDFHSHDIEIYTDENRDDDYRYIEKQIGCFTADDPCLEYDEEHKKTYVIANAVIPEDYTMAADIIRRKNGTDVSCELCIDSFSYNAKEHYLELEDFYFSGVTCLGSEKDGTAIQPGMEGSHLDIADFSVGNNSLCAVYSKDDKLIETLERLNNTLSNFNIDNNLRKGGLLMDKFKELLEKYNKTEADITFEYDGLSDEELEAKFKEMFDSNDSDTDPDDDEEPDVNINIDDNDDDSENDVTNFQKTFEISHDDIRCALYNLLAAYEDTDDEWYYITAVYDSYFAYENFRGDKIYGQNYTKEEDNVAFDGERYNLHKELLTDSEYAELKTMRSNYSEIQKKLEKYVSEELKAEKESIFEKDAYASYLETEEFKNLKENMDKYSVDELAEKAELAFAKCVQKLGFSMNEDKTGDIKDTKVHCTRLPINTKAKKKSRYGSLFSK